MKNPIWRIDNWVYEAGKYLIFGSKYTHIVRIKNGDPTNTQEAIQSLQEEKESLKKAIIKAQSKLKALETELDRLKNGGKIVLGKQETGV